MKIWQLADLVGSTWAQCALRSPPRATHHPCAKCTFGSSYEMMPIPLAFEWEPGSDQIADFVWPSSVRVAVQEHVIELLVAKGERVRAGDIEMVQDPKLKRPKNLRRAKPRVWLPYTGPKLVELVIDLYVHALPETTTIVMDRCDTCGRENRHLTGVESKKRVWSPARRELVPDQTPRVPGQGLFVSCAEVGAAGLFRTYEFPGTLLCTDGVKAAIEEAKLTNIDFLEYGDLV